MVKMNRLMHKCVFFNYCIFMPWVVCNGLFFYCKLDYLKIPSLLVGTAYLIMTVTMTIKLYLVFHRQFTSDISKLTQFFLLTILIQMPIVSFFLITFPSQMYTPVEVCLHVLLLFMTIIEGGVSFYTAWKTVKCVSNHSSHYFPTELQTLPPICEPKDQPTRIFRINHTKASLT